MSEAVVSMGYICQGCKERVRLTVIVHYAYLGEEKFLITLIIKRTSNLLHRESSEAYG